MSRIVSHRSALHDGGFPLRLRIARVRAGLLSCLGLLGVPLVAAAQRVDAAGPARHETWFERSDRAKAEQPHWITPLATTTPRLEQEFRYDVLWQQPSAAAPSTETIGNTKGLELIPWDRLEVIAAVPPYLLHHSATVADGFGDFQLLLKLRLVAAPAARGDYILTAFLGSTFPTGSGTNGQPSSVVTPTLAYGKGFGAVDLQGTAGAAIPATDAAASARAYMWNNTFQCHLARVVWPEVEVNATWFRGGKNDGKEQVFVTPGFVVGRLALAQRVGLTLGAGLQLPVSSFHTSEHNIIASVRVPF